MELQKAFLDMIEEDINRITEIVEKGDDEKRWYLFRELDGRYQACIKDFYGGMWLSIPGKNILHFPQLRENPDYVIDNLKLVKSKLETFRYQANAIKLPSLQTTQVNVNVNVNISFDEAKQRIEDMPGLTAFETDEIKSQIDALENISKEQTSKKKKWEKVKPILSFALDKGADVAIAIMSLIMQMNLGM